MSGQQTHSIIELIGRPLTVRQRVVISIIAAAFGAWLIWTQYSRAADFHTDFGVSWFGARSILHGVDPYPLVGKGKTFDYRWPLIYPAPSLIALIPLGFLSERVAATIFVALSTFVLSLGMTQRGPSLLPLFMAEPYLNAARLGQWNIALTASLFLPWIAFFGIVKPQTIAPILSATRRRATIISFTAGSALLVSLAFVLVPGWMPEWIAAVHQMPDATPAVMRYGGFLILLVLSKWRRPEAWLVAILAVVPQNPAFYSTLPLFTVPASFIESCILALVMTLGGFSGAMTVGEPTSLAELNAFIGSLQVFTIYLPAVLFILRRPNEGPMPFWLEQLSRIRKKAA